MDFLSFITLEPNTWAMAAMAFLRVFSILIFLPIFGDQVVPLRLKISFALAFSLCLYPLIWEALSQHKQNLQWSPLMLGIATVKEVFLGFAIGFAAKMIFFGTAVASHIVGTGMGFQAASMFNPALNQQESSFSVFKNWIVLLLLLALNVHYVFLEGIVKSFLVVPLGFTPDAVSVAKVAQGIVEETFSLGLRLAAPLIAVQVIINISLGLLNRFIPQLNVFVISFPLNFIVSMSLLAYCITSTISILGNYGMQKEVAWFDSMKRALGTQTIK